MIAFYGMGLLGSNFVRALRKRGEAVRVWNRNPERAEPLAAEGAVVVKDPVEAARGASRIHLTLSDDAAVDDVLERVRPGLSKGAVIVDHTTTSPSGTRARATRWAERGFEFQHAPVFMGPQNALESSGVMLASGDRARFDRLSPELSKMTGRLLYLGPEPERAASFKLLGNEFLMFVTAGLADFFALAKALGIEAKEASALFDPSIRDAGAHAGPADPRGEFRRAVVGASDGAQGRAPHDGSGGSGRLFALRAAEHRGPDGPLHRRGPRPRRLDDHRQDLTNPLPPPEPWE